ncbi:hypothetical protein D3C78_1752060 [compost metagenome]
MVPHRVNVELHPLEEYIKLVLDVEEGLPLFWDQVVVQINQVVRVVPAHWRVRGVLERVQLPDPRCLKVGQVSGRQLHFLQDVDRFEEVVIRVLGELPFLF